MHGTFIKHREVLKNLNDSQNYYFDKIIINDIHVTLVLNLLVTFISVTDIKVYV